MASRTTETAAPGTPPGTVVDLPRWGGPPGEPSWPEDLEALFRVEYAPMVRLAYLLTDDNGAAEEIVQDSFVALARRRAKAANPGGYLRTTVVNRSRSWHRRQAVERRFQPRLAPPVPVVELPTDHLWDAIQDLPFTQRAAIVLRFYEDLSEAEAATVLGCRPGTIGSAVHRGLARLREVIEP